MAIVKAIAPSLFCSSAQDVEASVWSTQSAQRAETSQVCTVCCPQAPSPPLCHGNSPVTYEEHHISQFELFQESFCSPFLDTMLCLLVLFHWFVLKVCVLYAQFITPGICCSHWHQPGNVTWQFIARRNHYLFSFLVFCNRRCSLWKSQPFSSQVFSCSAAITYCQLLLSPSWNVTEHMLAPQS